MDIQIVLKPGQGAASVTADWSWEQLMSGARVPRMNLQNAILICLFTDALADPDSKLNGGQTDRRGWWGNSLSPVPIGSNFWQLEGSNTDATTLALAVSMAQRSLAALVTRGLLARADVTAAWLNGQFLEISVTAVEPSGNSETYQYSRLWATQ